MHSGLISFLIGESIVAVFVAIVTMITFISWMGLK